MAAINKENANKRHDKYILLLKKAIALHQFALYWSYSYSSWVSLPLHSYKEIKEKFKMAATYITYSVGFMISAPCIVGGDPAITIVTIPISPRTDSFHNLLDT